MTEKLYYTMGEVAEMFDVRPSLLRHWQTQFASLRPKRNKKGNRLYTPADVEQIKVIYHLVKERGMTLEGARKALSGRRAASSGVGRDTELMERLQRIRSILLEVREELRDGAPSALPEPTEGTDAPDPAGTPDAAPAASASRRGRKAVVKLGSDAAAGAETSGDAEPDPQRRKARPDAAPDGKPRKPRRRKEDAEDKELFAFYEQSLF